MKLRLIFATLCIVLFSWACSSSDDSDDGNPQMMNQDPHFTLRVNGNGYDDELFSLYRDTINASGNNVLIIASARNVTDYIALRLPTIEEGTKTIVPYVSGDPNTASFVIQDDGIYLCEDGTITVSEIVGAYNSGNCYEMKGSLNINFRRQDNTPGNINISGTFDLPSAACTSNN